MELDNAVSARDAAAAQVDAHKAAVDKAQLDLGYTTITSPIDGLVGTTKVKAGNLVGRGESTLLVTISVIDPIFFRAGIGEAEYLRLVAADPGAGGRRRTAREDADRADPRRRHGAPAQGVPRRRRAQHRPDDRHPRRCR